MKREKRKKNRGEFRISSNRKTTQQRSFMALNGKSAISTNVTNNFIEKGSTPNRRNDLKVRSCFLVVDLWLLSISKMWQDICEKGVLQKECEKKKYYTKNVIIKSIYNS